MVEERLLQRENSSADFKMACGVFLADKQNSYKCKSIVTLGRSCRGGGFASENFDESVQMLTLFDFVG